MNTIRALNRYFIPYRSQVIRGTLFVIFSNIFGVLVPVLVREGFNAARSQARLGSLFAGTSLSGDLAASLTGVTLLFGILILLASAIKGWFMYLMRQNLIVVSRKIEYDLKNDIYLHYQNLPLGFFRRNYTGDLMARLSEDVSNVRMYIGPAVMYFINFIITFISVIFIMFWVNPTLSLWVLLPLPFLSLSIYYVSSVINSRSTAIQQQLSSITTFAQETFSGIRVLKSFGAEKSFVRSFEAECEEFRSRNLKLARVNAMFFPLMTLLVGLSTIITVYLGGKAVARGEMTFGNIAEFVIYLNMLIWPVASLGWVTALVQKASASKTRIDEFMNEAPEAGKLTGKPFQMEQELEFKDVSLTYPNQKFPAMEHFSLKIRKGEKLGITGKTGSGKSSLINLMLRLYDPDSGQITSDGIPLSEFSLHSMREKIAYVPQDTFLFSDTLSGNVAFGFQGGEVNEQAVQKAIRSAALEGNVADFPEGMNTMLGERGISLSGGQKQRLSIARALVRDAEILVLDDCFSAMDPETEVRIIENLRTELEGKTTVLVSHRISGLLNCDRIVVMDRGRIAEIGSPAELMEHNGLYAAMYRRQMTELESI